MRKMICILLFFSFPLAGCAPLVFFGAGTAAGVAGYKYYEGALNVVYQASYDKTWEATVEAVEKMNLRITSKNKEKTSGRITAVLSDGRTVTIDLKYQSLQETEVLIRVGVFGDENASMLIKDEISKALFN